MITEYPSVSITDYSDYRQYAKTNEHIQIQSTAIAKESINIIDNKVYIEGVLPGTEYSLLQPIEVIVEKEDEYFYISSKDFFTVGAGSNLDEALSDFGLDLVKSYLTYKRISPSKQSRDMKVMIMILRSILIPTTKYAIRFTGL